MIKAIILDFDDTLCLTLEAGFKMQNEVIAKMGRNPIDKEILIKTWGGELSKSMQLRSPGIDFPTFKKLYDETVKDYVSRGEHDKIPEENIKTLEELLRQGRYIAILTSRSVNEVTHLLDKRHPLAPFIKDIYHKDNLEYLKPDPRVFKKVLEEHNFAPKECVYVGDALSDAEAAIGAGMNFVASLESELKTKDDFRPHNVKYFINRFPELLKVIKELDI